MGREARNCAIVIDDCRTSRASLAWAMIELGFQVNEYEDAESCLAFLDGGACPTLVFVDLHMPGMDGLRFIETVRSRSHLDPAELILATSETSALVQVLARRAGAGFLAKPFDRGTVLDALSRAGVALPPATTLVGAK
jgi:two-component system nitrogen regulation response regulator GlnG